jgi:hypothetical protein
LSARIRRVKHTAKPVLILRRRESAVSKDEAAILRDARHGALLRTRFENAERCEEE